MVLVFFEKLLLRKLFVKRGLGGVGKVGGLRILEKFRNFGKLLLRVGY